MGREGDDGFAHFPPAQRVVRLSEEEAGGEGGIPGWGGEAGVGVRSERVRGQSRIGVERRSIWNWGWSGSSERVGMIVETLPGTTVSRCDAILTTTSWQSLFVG